VGTGQALPRRLIAGALVVAGCATVGPNGPSSLELRMAKVRADPEIVSMVAAVDPARVQSTIEKLAAFPTRNSCSGETGILAAESWLREQLSSLPGLSVSVDAFSVCDAERHNVLAILPGADPSRVILVGAHYDSRSTGRTDGDARSPGANDSGSQAAVLLEVARALAGHRFAATLALVAFAGEEQGLLGSSSVAAHADQLFPGARIEAVLNCDIVGGDRDANRGRERQIRIFAPGTPREIKGPDGTTDDTSPSRNLQRAILEIARAYVPEAELLPQLREDRPGRGGDHEPFIGHGVAGVRFIEAAETLAHQHSPDDTPEQLLPGYAGRVARVVVAAAASLARAPAAPTRLSAGDRRVTFAPVANRSHYVLEGRAAGQLAYTAHRIYPVAAWFVEPARLGLGAPYWASIVAVDGQGHRSLPAYPEVRCDDAGCAIPSDALDPTVKN
jgi:acetylornithine deacetylase/succinyl-diaminopimelate desuccinylase-like protein